VRTHLIDAATLTGACVVALGMVNAGAFSNDDAIWAKFDAALATSGEKFWRLPLGEEYAELIKSDIGDIKNTGGRWGGASTAAEFLRVFVEDTPWIHLDIAGLAWVEDAKPYIAKGPSGVAVSARFWSGCGVTRSLTACSCNNLWCPPWSQFHRDQGGIPIVFQIAAMKRTDCGTLSLLSS
jgi:hypothetical protein